MAAQLVRNGRKGKRVSFLWVAVWVLAAALAMILLVSMISSIVSAKAEGTMPKLTYQWSATQAEDEFYAKVKVDLYVEFTTMHVTSRKDNNKLVINDEPFPFVSPSIRESGIKKQSKLIASQEIMVYRIPGTTVSCPIEAVWNFSGMTDEGKVGQITLSDSFTLDNFSIQMKSPSPKTTEPPQTDPPETRGPDETTEPPETNPPETVPPETNPPETNPPVIDPPETKPLPEEPVDREWVFQSDTGTPYLVMYANCNAVEDGKKDAQGNRLATVYVRIYFEYYSLFMSERVGCTLQVGDERITFSIPAISEDDVKRHTISIAYMEKDVKVGDTVKLHGEIPYVGYYGNAKIDGIRVDGVMEMR